MPYTERDLIGVSSAMGSGLIGAQIQQQPEKRAPQISVQLEIMQKELAANEDALNLLIQRLTPALSLANQAVEKEGKDPSNGPTCPIANFIWSMAQGVSKQTRVIREATALLEI